MATLQLDVAHEEDTVEEALATIPADIGVTHEVVDPNGPGGGWPIVEFTGSDEAIERLVREWYSPDDAETAHHLLTGE